MVLAFAFVYEVFSAHRDEMALPWRDTKGEVEVLEMAMRKIGHIALGFKL